MNGRMEEAVQIWNYTFIRTPEASAVDYVICPSDLFDICNHFDFESRSESPHLPVTMCLLTPCVRHETCALFKFVWKQERCEGFIGKLTPDDVVELFKKAINAAYSSGNDSVQYIGEVLYTAAEDVKKRPGNTKYKEPWYNIECESLKRQNADV